MRLSIAAAVVLASCHAAPTDLGFDALSVGPRSHGARQEQEVAEERHENVVNAFVGGVTPREEGNGGAVLGVDYERRLGERFGVGAFTEWVLEVERTFSLGAQFYWHPYDELLVAIGPGVERADGEWGMLLRLGVGYEIPLGGGWIMTPEVFYDFSEFDNLFIWGVNVGRGF